MTSDQQSELLSRENGVTLVVGCRAAGLDELKTSLNHAATGDFFVGLRGETHNDFQNLLGQIDIRTRDGTTVLFIPATARWTIHWVEDALSRISRLTSKNRYVRMVFVADPKQAWLLTSPQGLVIPKSAQLRVSNLRPWHDAAVRQLLEDAQLPSDEAARQKVERATGNWSLLLRQLYGKSLNDSIHFEAHLDRALQSLHGAWAKQLAADFGLEASPARKVLDLLNEYQQPVSREDLITLADDLPPQEVDRVLQWADLLGLITRGRGDTRQLDPLVARILTATQSERET